MRRCISCQVQVFSYVSISELKLSFGSNANYQYRLHGIITTDKDSSLLLNAI